MSVARKYYLHEASQLPQNIKELLELGNWESEITNLLLYFDMEKTEKLKEIEKIVKKI